MLWSLLILSFSTDDFSYGTTAGWIDGLVGDSDVANFLFRKAGHLLGYSILAVLAWRADRRFLPPLALAALVALTDETRQTFTQYRQGSPWDVVLDLAGATLTLALLRAWQRRRDPM